MSDGIDELARARLDRAEHDIREVRGEVKDMNLLIAKSDLSSAERHGVSQAQNGAILAKLEAVDKRLNEPSALISLLGNKAAVGGAATLLGAVATLAVALGYGGAKVTTETPPLVVVHEAPVAPEDDEVHRPDIAP